MCVYQKEVVCVWTFAANFVQLHQVIELTVDVTTDGDWCIHSLYIALIHQDLTRLGTQRLHLRLLQVLTTLHKRGSGGEGGMARVVCVSCVHHAMAQRTHTNLVCTLSCSICLSRSELPPPREPPPVTADFAAATAALDDAAPPLLPTAVAMMMVLLSYTHLSAATDNLLHNKHVLPVSASESATGRVVLVLEGWMDGWGGLKGAATVTAKVFGVPCLPSDRNQLENLFFM